MVSIAIMAGFFIWWRRETRLNVRLAFEEQERLENIRIYGKANPD